MIATLGHIKDLPPKTLGVDLTNQFAPSYLWLKGKKALFSKIRKLAQTSESIYLGTDPDREGEFIAFQIQEELLKLKKPIFRCRFYEITKPHVNESVNNPTPVSKQLVDSQIARRVVDRLYGYTVSPRLWRELKIDQLSAGRVQSTVLQWICEKEEKIRNFMPEPYTILNAIVSTDEKVEVPLIYSNPKGDLLQKPRALKVLEDFKMDGAGPAKKGTVLLFVKEEKKPFKTSSPKPFTTAALQEMASRVLGLSPKETLRIASSLYEGIPIPGKGIQGLITYIRTDSIRVSPDKVELGEKYLKREGYKIVSSTKKIKPRSNPFSQEAHEAIVPLDPFISPDFLGKTLTKQELSLYHLIWKRFLQSLMGNEKGIVLTRDFSGKNHVFQNSFTEIHELGFQAFEKKDAVIFDPFRTLQKGDEVSVSLWELEEKKTKHPIRFTEGSLVHRMEATGIGRPSTYAAVLLTLQKRKYVRLEKKSLVANLLGEKVNSFVSQQIPDLLGVDFTKNLEEKLDLIAGGSLDRVSAIQNFYSSLQKSLSEKRKLLPLQTENALIPKKEPCPTCQIGFVVKKRDRQGNFIKYCNRFPHCDFAERMV